LATGQPTNIVGLEHTHGLDGELFLHHSIVAMAAE